jgi:hypothetical protein
VTEKCVYVYFGLVLYFFFLHGQSLYVSSNYDEISLSTLYVPFSTIYPSYMYIFYFNLLQQ